LVGCPEGDGGVGSLVREGHGAVGDRDLEPLASFAQSGGCPRDGERWLVPREECAELVATHPIGA